MTEQQKEFLIGYLTKRVEMAEKNDLPHTAKSWRDLIATLQAGGEIEIIYASRNIPQRKESQ